eukprot:CAMPEP_0185190060 /NCGR_PEP_ID=MMETSP1140-20130426/6414_1 /TAXON_ID=298111 /ORGANISM="Pavlova sp., Strain CCMP459" /LENGTH=37 /DNA_ID= /DNA_START= /DNA_END= /DNA_ORIENTATION=
MNALTLVRSHMHAPSQGVARLSQAGATSTRTDACTVV